MSVVGVLRRTPRASRSRSRVPASALLLASVVLFCLVGPLLVSGDATTQDSAHTLSGFTSSHWLGTDELGRDLGIRLMVGGRLSLFVAVGAVAVALVVGTAWGLLAASRRGWADEILMRGADALMAIPQILFALVCVAAFGASLTSLALIGGLLLAPSTARMARALASQEMAMDYYTAGVATGTRRTTLLWREVLPNMLPGIGSQAVINAASAMILEASLSFVGLGVQPPSMSWGVLLQQGYAFLYSNASYAILPAAFLLGTVLSLNAMADRLSSRAEGGVR
jgi:peptide/nickel transport system permease protein